MKYNPHATPEPKTDGASPTFRGGARGRADGEVSERGKSVGVRFVWVCVCVCVYSGRLGVTLTCVESPPALDPHDAPQRVLRPSIPRKRARRRRARRWLASPRGRSGLSRLGILRLQPDLHQLYRVEDDRRGDAGAAAAHQVLPQAPLRGRHRGLKAPNVARARASSSGAHPRNDSGAHPVLDHPQQPRDRDPCVPGSEDGKQWGWVGWVRVRHREERRVGKRF